MLRLKNGHQLVNEKKKKWEVDCKPRSTGTPGCCLKLPGNIVLADFNEM